MNGPPPTPSGPWLGLGVGLGAVAIGSALLLVVPWVPPPRPPPPPLAPAPAPVPPPPWPTTQVVADVTKPHDDPVFRESSYRFRSARLLRFADRIELVVDHGEDDPVADRCAADPLGTNHTVELGAVDLGLGDHPVDGALTQGVRRRFAYTLTGTLSIVRVEGDRVSGTLDLDGALSWDPSFPAQVSGPFTAGITDCRDRPDTRPGSGPGAVRYLVDDLQGSERGGTLTYASLLTGTELGDLLVLHDVPTDGCVMRSDSPGPVDSVVVFADLPRGPGVHALEPGLGPMGASAKLFSFVPPHGSRSHILGIRGAVTVTGRGPDHLSGQLTTELIAVDSLLDPALPPMVQGTLSGPLHAEIVDCSRWTGPYPL